MKRQYIPLLLVILAAFPGCGTVRRMMARDDYSTLQPDPFLETDDINARDRNNPAYSDVPSGRRSGTAGVARLDGPTPLGAGADPTASFDGRAVQTADRRTAVSPGLAVADYPEELSDRVTPASGSGATGGPSLADFVDSEIGGAVTSAAEAGRQSQQSAVSRAGALDQELEDFAAFLETQGAAPVESVRRGAEQTATQVGNAAREAVGAGTQSFSDWASEQQQSWGGAAAEESQQLEAEFQRASKLLDEINAASQAAGSSARPTAEPLIRPAPSAAVVPEARETPVNSPVQAPGVDPWSTFQRPGTGIAEMNGDLPASAGTAADAGGSNPFDDYFGPSDASGAGSTAAPQAGSAASADAAAAPSSGGTTTGAGSNLDDSFRMDTGWRPSHIKRP